MNKDEIFEVVRNTVLEVLPELEASDIKLDSALSDLGANSIDRSEIVMQSMMELNVKVPLVEVGPMKNINELVEFYVVKLEDGE